jgi:glycosyltransferase involved in cell wall biosynthesis
VPYELTASRAADLDAAVVRRVEERLARDPDLRQQFGRAGREKVVAEFDVRRNARALAELFGAVEGKTTCDAEAAA